MYGGGETAAPFVHSNSEYSGDLKLNSAEAHLLVGWDDEYPEESSDGSR